MGCGSITQAAVAFVSAIVVFVALGECHPAVTIDAEWRIANPNHEDAAVRYALSLAAEEIQTDIQEAIGVKLPIVSIGCSSGVPANKTIWLGKSAAENAGLDISGFNAWDNAYAEKGGNLYFYGNDRPGRNGLTSQQFGQTFFPSARAAARFLRDVCGVRFVMPGRVGTEVPKLKKIAVPVGMVSRETPTQSFGSFVAVPSITMHAIANGFFTKGSFHSYGGHTYPVACPGNVYFKVHPEYFAMVNGRRTLGLKPHLTALCISNPDVEELIVDELKRRFDAGADVCQLAQHDGSSVCECEKCKAMYGTGDDWCEKFWLFHRHIAERMIKERPGKIVNILSYGKTHHPPSSFKVFPANVMVELCGYSEEAFKEWKSYTVPHGFTVYIYHWGNYPRVGFTPKRSLYECRESARRFVKNRVHGVYRCGGNFDMPGMEGPQYYMFNRALENPEADIDATLTEFCDAAFGCEAGRPMKNFYIEIDRRLRAFDRMSATFSESPCDIVDKFAMCLPDDPLDLLAFIYTADLLNAAEGSLSLAEKARSISGRQKKRLVRVRMEFEYVKAMGLIAGLYGAYKYNPSKEGFILLANAIKQRREIIDGIFDANDRHKPLTDWPDVPLFGGNSRTIIDTNGRLSARIRSPLDWDVDRMLAEEDYPWMAETCKMWKRHNAEKRLPANMEWKVLDKNIPDVFEMSKDKTRIKFGAVTNNDVTVVARLAPKGGLKPNTCYRISWFARIEDVSVVGTQFGTERGFYALIRCDGDVKKKMRVPSGAAFRGSFDWRHMSGEIKTSTQPWNYVEMRLRLQLANGSVEIEDLTIEELP